jgi:heme-degrading monooxygenase HmoA
MIIDGKGDERMHTSTIRFILPEDTDWNAIRALLRERAQMYVDMPGLISKAFLCDPASREYGGNYVWETREALDAFLHSDMFRRAVEKFGQPDVRIHEVAAYLDKGEVIVPAGAAV